MARAWSFKGSQQGLTDTRALSHRTSEDSRATSGYAQVIKWGYENP